MKKKTLILVTFNVVTMVGSGVLLGMVLTAGLTDQTPTPTLGPATTNTSETYDDGFRDGVEYQSWFTCNEVEIN